MVHAIKSGEACEHTLDTPNGKKWILKDIPIAGNGGSVKAVVEFARMVDGVASE